MADRPNPAFAPISQGDPLGARSLSDRLPIDALDRLTEAEAALLAKLKPGQLRAVASWLRAIAPKDPHQSEPLSEDQAADPAGITAQAAVATALGHSFRAQASRLDHLARQARPDGSAIIGTLMSSTWAYLLTAAGDCQRQPLGEAVDAPPEPCEVAELQAAYGSDEFSVVLGAVELAQRFGPRFGLGLGSGLEAER
jgi:hypothetical protein